MLERFFGKKPIEKKKEEKVDQDKRNLLVAAGSLIGGEAIAQVVPSEGKRIRREDANFAIFPEKLNFKLGKNTLIVSVIWQTAAVYKADGTIFKILHRKKNNQGNPQGNLIETPFYLQVGTGKSDSPTPLGLTEIQTHNNVNYQSHEFIGAPMPYAMHLGYKFINPKGEVQTRRTTGIAVHGRDSVDGNSTRAFMSHACIGVEIATAKYLQSILQIGDQVLIVGDKIPEPENGDIKNIIPKLTTETGDVSKKIRENKQKAIEERDKKERENPSNFNYGSSPPDAPSNYNYGPNPYKKP